MSFLPSFLRPAALAAATLVCALTPSASVTTATTAVIAATAATMVTASEAEARPRVRDHAAGVKLHRESRVIHPCLRPSSG